MKITVTNNEEPGNSQLLVENMVFMEGGSDQWITAAVIDPGKSAELYLSTTINRLTLRIREDDSQFG